MRGTDDTNHKMSNETGSPRAKVFLVDDHALVRKHLRALIEGEPDLEVCGEAADVPTALARIQQGEPDLVILDITLKGSSGLDLLDALKGRQPRPAVVVLSVHEEAFYVKRALEAGALGYITKEEATVEILTAIRRVLRGQPYVSHRMADPMAEQQRLVRRTVLQEARV